MDHSAHNKHIPAVPADPHQGHSMSMPMMPGEMSMHAMSFHFGSSETVLFSFWQTSTPLGIIASSLLIVLLAFALEGTRWIRVTWRQRVAEAAATLPAPTSTDDPRPPRKLTAPLVGDSILHALQLTLGYLLMLVFMTFNVWLCAAVIIGETIAHLSFRYLFPETGRIADAAAVIQGETCCG